MKPSDKLTESQYELAVISNLAMKTEKECAAIRKYEKQCLADTEAHEAQQQEDCDEQVGE